MQFPKWAPPELIELYNELKPRADAEKRRHEEFKAANHPEIDWKTYLASGEDLQIGRYFIGDVDQLQIIEALITKPAMEDVWKSLLRRSASFHFVRMFFGGKTQVRNLVGACVQAEMNWLNVPKRTRTEAKRLHEDIAAKALQLCELLVAIHHSGMLDTRRYIAKEKAQRFIDALEEDGHEPWLGLEGYLDHLLFELLPSVPRILLELHKRALEHAKYPHAVTQPNAPNAKLNFFIHELSAYFNKAYGQPLHARVAAIVSALFNVEIDEDRVRALLKSRKNAASNRTRKKIAEGKKEISG